MSSRTSWCIGHFFRKISTDDGHPADDSGRNILYMQPRARRVARDYFRWSESQPYPPWDLCVLIILFTYKILIAILTAGAPNKLTKFGPNPSFPSSQGSDAYLGAYTAVGATFTFLQLAADVVLLLFHRLQPLWVVCTNSTLFLINIGLLIASIRHENDVSNPGLNAVSCFIALEVCYFCWAIYGIYLLWQFPKLENEVRNRALPIAHGFFTQPESLEEISVHRFRPGDGRRL